MVIEITTKSGEHIKLTTDSVEDIKINELPFGDLPQKDITNIVDEWVNGVKE